MRLVRSIVVVVLTVSAPRVWATSPPATQPAEMTGAEAGRLYDAAMKVAADNYKAAVARADKQYMENLNAALASAMARGPRALDEANGIDAQRQAAAVLAADHKNSTAFQAASQPSPRPVYLSTLGPIFAQTFGDGSWGFGGNGYVGNVNFDRIEVTGMPACHGLGTQPPTNGSARVVYDLDGQYSDFSGSVAIADTGKAPRSALVFHIDADGRELWRSTPLSRAGRSVPFKVDLSGASRLELIVDCAGPNNDDHAVWVDPILKPVRALGDVKADNASGAEGVPPPVNSLDTIVVNRAFVGAKKSWTDVTKLVREHTRNGVLDTTTEWTRLAPGMPDPDFGHRKYLSLDGTLYGLPFRLIVSDGTMQLITGKENAGIGRGPGDSFP